MNRRKQTKRTPSPQTTRRPKPPASAQTKAEPDIETDESFALNALDSFYYPKAWTWADVDRDIAAFERERATSTDRQLRSILCHVLSLSDQDLKSMTPDQIRHALGSPRTHQTQGEVSATRKEWMEQRRPGWSLTDWRDHAGPAYETLKKYRDGITTHQTPKLRAALAKVEKVPISTVPE